MKCTLAFALYWDMAVDCFALQFPLTVDCLTETTVVVHMFLVPFRWCGQKCCLYTKKKGFHFPLELL